MHIEGLITHKTPYKERDLICELLLRSGNKLPVYFYGGRGGGRNLKGSILEVGHMLSIDLNERRKAIGSDIQIAKEYKLLWAPENIRLDFSAYYLSVFFMEYISKVALEEEVGDSVHDEHSGLFNVLSNGLFYLDKAVKERKFNSSEHLFLFFSKLCVHLGVVPHISNCLYCDIELKKSDMVLFDHQDGGFSCMDCTSKKDEFLSENKDLLNEYQSSKALRMKLSDCLQMAYKDISYLNDIEKGMVQALFNYINFQFGFTKDQFKTWKIVGES